VVEVTRDSFEREVIERSKQVPVAVDFWAEWCGPCRMLGPVLEKLSDEYDGRFVLAKADTEQLPDVASAFGVRGIPAVFGLRDGRVVDSFVGVQSEQAIRAFLDGLMPSEAETLAAEAERLGKDDPKRAEQLFRQAIQIDQRLTRAKVGLAGLMRDSGRLAEAREIIQELEKRGFLEPEAETLKAELVLAEGAKESGGVEKARKAFEAGPKDKDAQLRLAEALAAAGKNEEALELALDLVERDRKGVGEEARKLMLAVFQVLPADSEVVTEYRRKLSLVL
jgi:putative thioredoxin